MVFATVLAPETLAPARGYSNGLLFPPGRLLFVAGQIGWTRDGVVVSDDFAEQFALALDNVLAVVREAGGEPHHVGRLTIYVTSRERYVAALPAIGPAYRARMGKHYPAMALLEIRGLLEPRALLEIEATAVLPA